MATQHTLHYELASANDVRQLVRDLASTEAGTIVVAFRPSDDWRPGDLELARLVATARTFDKQLIAERSAGSIAERAVELGFRDLAVVSDIPEQNQLDTNSFAAPSDGNEDPTATMSNFIDEPEPDETAPDDGRYNSTANLATYTPLNDNVTITWPGKQQAPQGSHSSAQQRASDKPSPQHRSRSTVVHTEQTTGAQPIVSENQTESEANAPRFPVPVGRMPASAERADEANTHETFLVRLRRQGAIKLVAAVLAPVLVLIVIAALAVYLFPTADITLVPEEEPISSSLTYGITADGQEFDISVEPTSLSTTTTAEAERATTGERSEPAGTASGMIQITNPLTTDVTIPAGSEIPGANGVTYYTSEDVQIPAADPFGSLAFGSANVGVYAGVTGPDGNLDAGTLTGQLGTQMFFTNPEAVTGGRLDQFSVISEEDIDAVREQVAAELIENAEDDFMSELPDGIELVPGTLEVGEPEVEVSAGAGEDGESVSASGSISVRAHGYDPEELHQVAGSEADRLLARQGGSERILLAETVSVQDPTAIDQDESSFRIEVEAIARRVITESEKEALIQEVTGLGREEAEQVLAEHPKVERFQISIEPSWLLDRMPEIQSRINVHVSSGESTASTR